MQYHPTTPTLIREPVVRAVALYAQERAAHSLREVVPGIYSLRYRHDTAGHADERIFLRAIAAHPTVARVDCTTAAEDELLGVDALLTLREGTSPIPIDVTGRGRSCRDYRTNLLTTLRRGVVPVVLEEIPSDLTPEAAFTAFHFWWQRSEVYFQARRGLHHNGDPAGIIVTDQLLLLRARGA